MHSPASTSQTSLVNIFTKSDCENDCVLINRLNEKQQLEDALVYAENRFDNWCEPEEEKCVDNIPLDSKIKAVILARQHPSWSIKTLQKKGSRFLKRKNDLIRWKAQIEKEDTKYDMYNAIDQWTYDRFKEARENLQQVTTREIQQWALAEASQYQSGSFKFQASRRWVSYFKNKQHIRQRKVTKYVALKKSEDFYDITKVAENFRKVVKFITTQYDTDYIINTDQTGCQYHSTFDRTLTTKGEKSVVVNRRSINNILLPTKYIIWLN
ncbi:hypothetical protein WN48_07846 [Eufriesea mexicana]|nr:hypothetical protein WN48_07846 [Eufriesea mexicana]